MWLKTMQDSEKSKPVFNGQHLL